MAGAVNDDIDIYSRKILQHTARLESGERLDNPDASARKSSRVCGSTIEVDLTVRDGVVTDFAQEVQACALGQTSASIVAEHIVGSTEEELRLVHVQMTAMLKADGAPPSGKWADLAVLETVRDFTPRHKSIMLVFDAVLDCFDQINGQSKNGAA